MSQTVSGENIDSGAMPAGVQVAVWPHKAFFTESVTTNVMAAVANRVQVYAFRIDAAIIITKLLWRQATGAVGSHGSIAVWSFDGLTKLIDSGAVNTQAGDVGIRIVAFAALTLVPNMYFLATTNDSGTPQVDTFGGLGVNPRAILQTSTIRVGKAANASVAGAMPASLGAITDDAVAAGPPQVLLQG